MLTRHFTTAFQLLLATTFVATSLIANAQAGAHPAKTSATERTATVETPKSANEVVLHISTSHNVMMRLDGSTPIRNWKMTAHGLNGEARMLLTNDNQLVEVRAFSFSLPVYNLKGDISAMDEDAYEALKADKHREITFQLSSAKVISQGESNYLIAASGQLTVAGVTRSVTLKMKGFIDRDGNVCLTGTENLKMSDYNVERPSLLFGAIKASDDISLTYNLVFTR
jgi:polyisoprenoid-binding protein YceI